MFEQQVHVGGMAGLHRRLGGFDARCPAPSPPPRPASRHPAALHPVSPSLAPPHLSLFNPSSFPVAGASLQKAFLGPDGVSRFFSAPSPRSPLGLPLFFFLFCFAFVFARCSPCPSSSRKKCTEKDSVAASSQDAMMLCAEAQCGCFFKYSDLKRRTEFRSGTVPPFRRRGGSEG